MVKMMQMLLVAEGVEAGKWTLNQPIVATAKAQHMGGTQVYLEKGDQHTLEELMLAVSVASANDAAMAVAEGLWGTEEKALAAMNKRARELGLTRTEYHSVHGLPPDAGEKSDMTTPRDLARLAQECLKWPLVRTWSAQKELTFRPGDPAKHSTNKLLWRMKECDGLKTGYTRAAGYCLTATAERDGVRLIAVVMGCKALRERFSSAQALLETGFAHVSKVQLVAKGQPLEPAVPAANSRLPQVRMRAAESVEVIIRESDRKRVKFVAEHPKIVRGPLDTKTPIGKLTVALDDITLGATPIVLEQPLEEPDGRWKMQRRLVERLGIATGG
jgi:D-alanyl-D-alanine carboxypeptidase (penicillin-binding protein 5/6)